MVKQMSYAQQIKELVHTQEFAVNSTLKTLHHIIDKEGLFRVPSNSTHLSPGHFLIGEPLTQLPAIDLINVKINRLSRWQTYQQ